MALPITVPYTFGNATTAIPLSNLDSDYATVYQAVNGIGNGSVALANVAITGGTISGNTTASNVTVSSGTFTNVTLSNVTISSVSTPITAAEGGTGSSSAFTTNGVVYASSTSALATGSGITYNGTTFSTTNDASINGLTVGRGAGAVASNTAVGYQAGYGNTTGTRNLFQGFQAAYYNTTGSDNTALGYGAYGWNTGAVNATGSSNTAVGSQALASNTTASNNTAVGYQAGFSNQTGANLVAIGYQAGKNNTGDGNVYVGALTGFLSTISGGYNTLVGTYAGYSLTSGTANTFLGTATNSSGYGAGGRITTGSKNTIIGGYNGNQGGLDISTASNYIVLSDGDGNPRVYVNDSGQLLKSGDSTSSRILPATDNVGYVGSSGNRWQAIYAVNGTIQTSDGRQKNTIQDSNLGLAFVNSLRPVSYKWNVGENVVTYNDDGEPVVTPRSGVRTHYGFIAQEVKAVIPDDVDFGGFVEEPNDGQMSLRYHEFIGPLVKAIQEQQTIITQLTARITALEGA